MVTGADRAEEVQAIQRLSVFGALGASTVAFLLERCELVAVAAGAPFFQQGDLGDAMYVLRTGRARVVRTGNGERLPLAELGSGECFGEVALVAIAPRSATVEALEDATALRLPHRALLELFHHDLEEFALLQMNLGREVARRLVAANEALFEQAQRLGRTEAGAASRRRTADALK
jgi:CRP-like cAMP-binding protein